MAFLPLFMQAQKADYCLSNVSVFKGNDSILLKNQFVLIQNGTIIDISADKKTTKRANKIIDGNGKFLMPGMWDMHVHFPSHDTANWQKLHLYTGVLHLRSMRGNPKELAYAQRMQAEKTVAPDFFVSATPISRKDDISNPDSLVAAYKKQGFSHLKILSIRDSAQFDGLAAACRKHGMAMAGHFPTNISMRKVMASGYNSNEHLGGLMSLVTEDPEYLDTALTMHVKNRIFACPTAEYSNIMYFKKPADCEKHDGINHFSEKTRKESYAELQDLWGEIDTLPEERKKGIADYFAKDWAAKLTIMRLLRARNGLMLMGADNGAYQISGVWGLLQEMQHFKTAGYTNYEILKIATYNGALYVNQAETLGVVQKGARADLLLLDANPLDDLQNLKKVAGVFKSGTFLDKAFLEKELQNLSY
jgi:Amidohydrolase family